jgi:prepilin-type N-terminal cleavage/methylation domain-containing protein
VDENSVPSGERRVGLLPLGKFSRSASGGTDTKSAPFLRLGAVAAGGGLLRSARKDGRAASSNSNNTRHRRAGFTLVEVIVVLVILAILAAIAIPALTGYIDKAQWRSVVMQCKTQMTAVQTMITDQTVRNGGVTTHAAIAYGSTNDYFAKIYDNVNGISPGDGYVYSTFTIAGKEEYEHLTGDRASFVDVAGSGFLDDLSKPFEYPVAYTDPNGAIRVYNYNVYRYGGHSSATPWNLLSVIYIQNIDSEDPVTQGFLEWFYAESTGVAVAPGALVNGWNVVFINPGTIEKLL